MSATNTDSFNFAELDAPLVIDIVGDDAAKVVNNLCTQDVAKLPAGESCEAFITNVRGWVVAHVICLKTSSGMRLLGHHPSPDSVCSHIDRYILREDAAIHDLSPTASLWSTDELASLSGDWLQADHTEVTLGSLQSPVAVSATMLGPNGSLLVGDQTLANDIHSRLSSAGGSKLDAAGLALARIGNFWPRSGTEILEKTLPQEMDRDAAAISFTKGCYLGQETIARLDARGQLQKKLCLVRLDSTSPSATQLTRDEKDAGSLLSSAVEPDQQSTLALAMLRRGNFSPGTQLTCGDCTAIVLDIPDNPATRRLSEE